MMESQITITEEKLKASEMVEVIMETEAHSGMSGISLSGGGKEGLFVADILKDSPAAKSLPILEGDQLISARVYFENVKYEDALKILQFMESYKASFCLKRTVPSSEVTISQKSGIVEVKGPKAKMPKMTVKNLTPVKKKKKKVPAGQVKVSEEGSMEAMRGSEVSVGNMEIPPVDVEFSLPKFSKFLKTKGAAESGVDVKTTEVSTKVSSGEQGWTKMRFPRLRVKEATAGGASAEVSEGKAASVEVEGKDKSVAAMFGISAPKMKKPKVDVATPKKDVKISPPKVEIETKGEKVFKPPEVELDISLPSIKAETAEICAKIPKIPDVEIKVPTSQIEIEAPEGKISMPQISKVGICVPKLEKESDVAIQVDGRPKTEIKMPSVELAAPKLDVDLSLPRVEGAVEVEPPAKGFQIKLPTFDISKKAPEAELKVTQVKKDIEVKVSQEKFKLPSMKAPEIGISLPKGKEVDSTDGKQKVSMKMPSLDVSAPKVDFDITLPRGGLEFEARAGESIGIPDVALTMPRISPPKVGMKVKDAYSELTKAKWEMPQVEVKTEKIEAESMVEIPDVSLKMPKISLPKFGAKGDAEAHEVEVKKGKVEGESPKAPKIKLPSFGLSLSKEKPDVEISGKEAGVETEFKQKFPSIKMPSLDISLPKVPDIHPDRLEVSGPSIKGHVKEPEMEGSEGLDFKLKMPKVSLPKFDMSVKAEKPQVSPPKMHVPKVDAKIKEGDMEGKMTFPKVDISIPKIKPVELDITSPKPELELGVDKSKVGVKIPKVGYDAIVFKAETGDAKMSLPSLKMPSLDIDTPKLDFDLNLPNVTCEGSEPLIKEEEGKIHMPKINLPKLSDVAKDMAVELDVPKIKGDISLPHFAVDGRAPETEGVDVGAKISLPKVGIDLGISPKDHDVERTKMAIKEKSEFKLPKVKLEAPDVDLRAAEAKIKMPAVKLPSVEIGTPKIPDVDIDASMPKVSIDSPGDVEVGIDSEVKLKAPKFSLRKLGISGTKSKKGVEADAKPSHVQGEVETTGKGFKMKMPKFGVSFPKTKHDIDVDTSKVAVEVDAKAAKAKKFDVSVGQVDGSSEGKMKLPSVKLPSLDISAPKLEVDIDLPKGQGDGSPVAEKSSDISIDIPDIKLPKFSMPKFGSKSKGDDAEIEMEGSKEGKKGTFFKSTKDIETSAEVKIKGKEGKMKMPSIKMPSFGMLKKDVEISDRKLEVGVSPPDVKEKKAKVVVKESKLDIEAHDGDGKTSFIKMPTFKMSPPKIQAPEVSLTMKTSKEDLRLPDVHVKVPHVELPSLGAKEGKVDITLPKADAKIKRSVEGPDVHITDKIKMPSLEVPELQLSVPCGKPEICIAVPKAEVDVSDADIKGYEGDLKIPKLPSFGFSTPSLDLDISLPKPKLDTSLEYEAKLEKSETKLKMPRVELPKFGEADAKVDIEGAKHRDGEAEAKMGSKIKMPHFDISLPKIKTHDDDIPFIEGEVKMHGTSLETSTTEGTFSLPSVELPKMSTPKIRAPELELDINLSKEEHKAEISGPEVGLSDLKFKMPKMKMPKFGGSSSGIDEEAAKVDVKSPKREEGEDSGMMGFKIKMPKLQVGSLKSKGGEDMSLEMEGDHKKSAKGDMKIAGHEESESGGRFKIKMPSFGISKGSTDAGTEPLHPTGEGGELKFKLPSISIPDVGFSGDEREGEVKDSSRTKGPKSSSLEDLDIDVGLKMPKLKMPTISMPGRKTDEDMTLSLEEDSEGKKSSFKMPDVELSSPKIKAHAEYDVGGATLEHSSKEMVLEGHSTKKSSKLKDEHKDHGTTEEDSGKKYKVKLPKFGISLPKPIPGDVELSSPKLKSEGAYSFKTSDTDHQEGKKAKKTFSLGRSKDKSSGLLDADASMEGDGLELKVKMPKIKMKPTFGMSSRSKAKGGEVNGEFDASARGEMDTDASPDGTTKSSKIKFPRLGFSSSKTNDVNGTGSPGSPSQINGENEVSAQNGSQDGGVKIGKLKLPKVEFTSPIKAKEGDSEMNLKLVKTDDSKEEDNGSSFAAKFKSPKISFSGFKKKEEHLGSSSTTMENVGEGDGKTGRGKISLGFLSSKSKGEYTVDNSGISKEVEGERSTKYKLPKVSLSPESDLEREETEGSQEGFTITMPKVGFTTHHEEQTTVEEEEVAGGFLKIIKTKQIKTETVTEKTVAI
ncbi:periaxin [Discoglossus pictus]